MLEQLKSLMDMRGFIFVVGLDPRAIGGALAKKHEDRPSVSLDEYMEKIFQIPYYLPRPDNSSLTQAIDAVLATLESLDADRGWLQRIAEARDKLDRYWPQNVRKVKRILNVHQVVFAQCGGSEDATILLAMLILRERWPSAWALLHTRRGVFDKIVDAWSQELAPGAGVAPIADEILTDMSVKSVLQQDDLKTFFVQVLLGESRDMDDVLKYARLLGGYINLEQQAVRSCVDD
jgi:hypothetical protein